MDCELVYFLLPRGPVERTFTDLARFHDPLAPHLKATEQSMALKAQDPGR
jgi:dethiobiotin synthetase